MSFAVNIMPSSGNLICWLRSHFRSSFNFLIIIVIVFVVRSRITSHRIVSITMPCHPSIISLFLRRTFFSLLHFSVRCVQWTSPNPCLKLSNIRLCCLFCSIPIPKHTCHWCWCGRCTPFNIVQYGRMASTRSTIFAFIWARFDKSQSTFYISSWHSLVLYAKCVSFSTFDV